MTEVHRKYYPDLEFLGNADLFVDDILEIIDHIKLFDDFSEDEIRVLSHHMKCFAAPRDYTLLREDADGDYLLLVLSGEVIVKKQIEGKGLHEIARVGVGDTVGEMSMVDGQHRFASCVTAVPTDFAVLTRAALNEILVQSPRLGNKFLLILLQLMTARLRDTCDRFLPAVYGSPV